MERIEEHIQTSPQVNEPADGRAELSDKQRADDADLSGGGNIDKIRDILFGVQMRDYEKRFARLEERLIKEAGDLRDDTKKRFDALELYIKQEFESLTQRLIAEQHTRGEAVETLSLGITDTARAFEKKAAQMEDQSAKSKSELRQQILDQSKSLNDEIRQKYEQLTAALQREAADLRTDKTDRSALAALFTEVAMRLNNDFKIPGAE